MIFIGIDPGKSGFTAILRPSGTVNCIATPTVKSGKKNAYDEAGMRRALLEVWHTPHPVVETDLFCTIERQQAYPKQGAVSNFSTGEGFGLWKGLLLGMRVPFEVVTPQAWKKAMLAGTAKDKGASIVKAGELFPGVDLRRTERCKGPSHDKAEALLIAEFGRRLKAGL